MMGTAGTGTPRAAATERASARADAPVVLPPCRPVATLPRSQASVQLIIRFGYHGGAFHGLQPQPGLATAGGALIARVMEATGQVPRALSFAARTDAGVHALANLASCRLRAPLNLTATMHQLITTRADGLRDVSVVAVRQRVMARTLAIAKHYRYTIEVDVDALTSAPLASPLSRGDAWILGRAVDIAAMTDAARYLLGTHDFTSFRDRHCSAKNVQKTLTALTVSRVGDGSKQRLHIDIKGNAFLRKMVRILVGTLVEVGCGLRTPESIPAILGARDRCAAGITAPACGLTLVAVDCVPDIASCLEATARRGTSL